MVEEERFMEEVLAKEAPVRAFGCTSVKSFVRQLNHYGFTKVPRDLERSPSLPEFLAEEEAIAAGRKVSASVGPRTMWLSQETHQIACFSQPGL